MPITGFSHYNLRARRELLDTLCEFYVTVVGMRRGERPPFARFGYWLYAGGEAALHLSETDPLEVRASDIATTFDHAAFNCQDRAEFEARLKSHAIEFSIGEVPETGQVQLFFRDPAGNGIELNFAESGSGRVGSGR